MRLRRCKKPGRSTARPRHGHRTRTIAPPARPTILSAGRSRSRTRARASTRKSVTMARSGGSTRAGSMCRRRRPPAERALLHYLLGLVAIASHNHVLHVFALLVVDLQRVAFAVGEFDLDLAKAAVLFGVAGVIREDVLVADGMGDVGEHLGERGLEAGKVRLSAGQVGKGVHLVVGLQVSHAPVVAATDNVDGSPRTLAGVSQTGILPGADGEDGDVARLLELFHHMIEVQLAEGIAAAGNQDDVLAALQPVQTVDGLVERVKEIGL